MAAPSSAIELVSLGNCLDSVAEGDAQTPSTETSSSSSSSSTAVATTIATEARSTAASDCLAARRRPTLSSSVSPGPPVTAAAGWIQSLRSRRLAICGSILTFLGVVVALLALAPAYRSQYLAAASLELARWTAAKEFTEMCTALAVSKIHEQYHVFCSCKNDFQR